MGISRLLCSWLMLSKVTVSICCQLEIESSHRNDWSSAKFNNYLTQQSLTRHCLRVASPAHELGCMTSQPWASTLMWAAVDGADESASMNEGNALFFCGVWVETTAVQLQQPAICGSVVRIYGLFFLFFVFSLLEVWFDQMLWLMRWW